MIVTDKNKLTTPCEPCSSVEEGEEIAIKLLNELKKSKTIDYYLKNVGDTNNTVTDNTTEQNYYAHNQKQNPHTPRVMISLGLNKDDVDYFVNKCLFPDII